MLPIKEVYMPRLLSLLMIAFFLAGSVPGAGQAEMLPHPAGLEPQVQFWIRVYSEVDTKGGLIHDSRHLDVVYEVIHFSDKTSRRSRDRATEAAKKKYAAALRSMAKGKRTNLTQTQEYVLSLWPEGVTNSTLRDASKRLRFQLGQSDKFKAGLVRSGAWRPYIREVFTERGVPLEITSLPHVESSFNPDAYSRIGAAGMWQFMRSTGKRYMRIDYSVDERLDPFKSTDAAARLLKDNYAITKSWPLAITAYNHGATGMTRAVKKLGTRDMDVIVKKYKSRTFGFASRNFYTSLLAASHVDQNAMKYFGALKYDKPVPFETVQIKHYYPFAALQKALGLPSAELKRYNPALRNPVLTGQKHVPKNFVLHVPGNVLNADAIAAISAIPNSQRYSKQHRDKYYTVERGDTLSTIARKLRVRQSDLMAANDLNNRHFIRVGQVLRLPGFAQEPKKTSRIASAPAHTGPLPKTYKVRRGDTISSIAGRFDISVKDLLDTNRLRNRNRIYVGQVLSLPGGESSATIVAAAKPAKKPVPAVAKPAVKTVAATKPKAKVQPKLMPAPVTLPITTTVAAIDPALPPVASPSPGFQALHEGGGARFSIVKNNRIRVQAEETVGHYADWLQVSASSLRRLNNMKYSTPLAIGKRFRLDFSKVSQSEFEQLRLEFHRSMQEDFFAVYEVESTRKHKLQAGDTLWSLARQDDQIPMWLLIQYNPDVDFNALHPGIQVMIPRIQPRQRS